MLSSFPLRQSMFAMGWLELKEPQRAWSQLEKCFSNITEPFKVSGGAADPSCSQARDNGIETHRTTWSIPNQLPHHLLLVLEQVWVENSDGSGAVNFLTGMGGFLQVILFGFTGFR